MNHDQQFRAYASNDRASAEQTTLDNVRDKLLRSAAAWDGMAVRQEGLAAARDKRERDKLAGETLSGSDARPAGEPA